MDFLVEFYDLNNNIADSFAFLENFRIIGAPQVIQGDKNVLSGSMYLGNLQGEGIELHGGSAYLRSIGYEGFQATISTFREFDTFLIVKATAILSTFQHFTKWNSERSFFRIAHQIGLVSGMVLIYKSLPMPSRAVNIGFLNIQ